MADELRPYQVDGIRKIFTSWRGEKRSVLFQMPTGTGKTVLFAEIVRRGFEKKRRILIAVHRIELVDQIQAKLREKGVTTGEIVARRASDYSHVVQVASIQTLSRREHPEANLVIIDECHHAKAKTYKDLWKIYPDAKFLGVTATPIRLSGEGFDDVFDELIVSPPIDHFVKQGWLVPIEHYAGLTPSLEGVTVRNREYVTSMLADVMMDAAVMSDLIESYQQKCLGKSTIVFAVDIAHSREIAARYAQAGITAAHIDSTTPAAERKEILTRFRKKEIKVVSNVEIITEGFDFPECEVVQLARPTKSLALYMQMVGRVMRPARGKKSGIVLDNAGLWKEHGVADEPREWRLTGKKKAKSLNQNLSDVAALDDDEVLRDVVRTRPSEVRGLRLVRVTPSVKEIRLFEYVLAESQRSRRKLLHAYHRWKDQVVESGRTINAEQFEYIMRRLNRLNGTADADRSFNKGFWYYERKNLGI